jgi:hypothetical protein
VQGGDLVAHVGLPGRHQAGAGDQRPAVGAVGGLGDGEHDAVDQAPARHAEDQQWLSGRRGGQHVQVGGDLPGRGRGQAGDQGCGGAGVGRDDDGVGAGAPGAGGDRVPADRRDRDAEVHPAGTDPVGQLFADRLHAAGRQPDGPAREAAPQQGQVAAGGFQPVLQQDPGEKGPEEALHRRLTHTDLPQPFPGGGLGLPQQPVDRRVPGPGGVGGDRGLVQGRPDRRAQSVQGRRRPAPRVDHPGAAAVDPDRRPGPEPAEVERRQVQVRGARVARVQHLEAAVDDEPVDPFGRQPATDVPARLGHLHVHARRTEPDRRGQPGQPGSADDDLGTGGQRHGSGT